MGVDPPSGEPVVQHQVPRPVRKLGRAGLGGVEELLQPAEVLPQGADAGKHRRLPHDVGDHFDRFVRDAGEPARGAVLPPQEAEPDMARLMRAADDAGIEILGPPGMLPQG